MGLLIGKAHGDTIVVMDSAALPIEGTETAVVSEDADGYMIQLADRMDEV
jgi:COP9 signalosome complex subunit 5